MLFYVVFYEIFFNSTANNDWKLENLMNEFNIFVILQG